MTVVQGGRSPRNTVLVDTTERPGCTLASIYSLRPTPIAGVSTPVTWQEVERGFAVADFNIRNIRARLRRRGDLWKPLLAARGRFDLGKLQ
jgi:bifunctional non-homologous end joining protein LigD